MTRFKDMKELTIKEWDGNPILCYYTDKPQAYIDADEWTKCVIGYADGKWVLEDSMYNWEHVYPVEWNKPRPALMTFHQLAIWLSRGDRLMLTPGGIASNNVSFNITRLEEEVPEDFRVGWEEDGVIVWHKPTVDLYKEV